MANLRPSKSMIGSNKSHSGINRSAYKQDASRKLSVKVPMVGVKPAVSAPKASSMKASSSNFKTGYKAPHEIHAKGVSGSAAKAMATMKTSINLANNLHDNRTTMNGPKGSAMNKNLGPKDMLAKRVSGKMGPSKMTNPVSPGKSLQNKSTKSSF